MTIHENPLIRKLAWLVLILCVGYALWGSIAVVYSPAARGNSRFFWILGVMSLVAMVACHILWGDKNPSDLTELKINRK